MTNIRGGLRASHIYPSAGPESATPGQEVGSRRQRESEVAQPLIAGRYTHRNQELRMIRNSGLRDSLGGQEANPSGPAAHPDAPSDHTEIPVHACRAVPRTVGGILHFASTESSVTQLIIRCGVSRSCPAAQDEAQPDGALIPTVELLILPPLSTACGRRTSIPERPCGGDHPCRRTEQVLCEDPGAVRGRIHGSGRERSGAAGPESTGKTTTVRILSTLIRADSGRAWIDGHDVMAQPHLVRAAIGLTGQYAGGGRRVVGAAQPGADRQAAGPVPGGGARPGHRVDRAVPAGGRRGPADEDVLRWHAAPTGRGGEPRRAASGAVPGRADDRAGPAAAAPRSGRWCASWWRTA
ncbi:hypothetical protein SANTM175S_05319 [Streptomyces antimycoticus]